MPGALTARKDALSSCSGNSPSKHRAHKKKREVLARGNSILPNQNLESPTAKAVTYFQLISPPGVLIYIPFQSTNTTQI